VMRTDVRSALAASTSWVPRTSTRARGVVIRAGRAGSCATSATMRPSVSSSGRSSAPSASSVR
jgi:hypothetical protein